MEFHIDRLLAEINKLDIKNAVLIDVSDISFSEEVRKYCEMNTCGKYGKNWSCPPGVGPVSELSKKAHRYEKGLVIQTVHPLKNSFDWKGMMAGKVEHDTVLRRVSQFARELGLRDSLLLGAGSCSICNQCAYTKGEPCCFPEEALASMEAYGIDVVKLAKDHDFPYHHGSGTVSYVGLLLYN